MQMYGSNSRAKMIMTVSACAAALAPISRFDLEEPVNRPCRSRGGSHASEYNSPKNRTTGFGTVKKRRNKKSR